MFVHVLKRLALMLAGYLVAVIAGLGVLLAVYLLLSSFPGAPDYFSALALSPVVMFAVPPLGLLVLWLSYILTAPQVAITALVSEFFKLRGVLLPRTVRHDCRGERIRLRLAYAGAKASA